MVCGRQYRSDSLRLRVDGLRGLIRSIAAAAFPLPASRSFWQLPPFHVNSNAERERPVASWHSLLRAGGGPRLAQKLEMFLAESKAAGIVRALIVNGSFVTAKPAPNDIDLLLVLSVGHDFHADLGSAQYKVVDRGRVRRTFGFDVLVAADGSAKYEALVRFFQRVRLQPGLTKGILRIEL